MINRIKNAIIIKCYNEFSKKLPIFINVFIVALILNKVNNYRYIYYIIKQQQEENKSY